MIIIKSHKATAPDAAGHLNPLVNAQYDAALALAERDSNVRRAIGDVLTAQHRLHIEETGNTALMAALHATLAAGVEPTPEAVTATLIAMRDSIDVQAQDTRVAAAQAKEAAKRHYTRMLPLLTAIGSTADALALEATNARSEASSLRQPTQAEEFRHEMLRIGASPNRVHELMTMLPPDPTHDKRIAEAARKTEAARIADGKAATLRALLAKKPLLDLEAVEAVAADYPAIEQALAALGLVEAAA